MQPCLLEMEQPNGEQVHSEDWMVLIYCDVTEYKDMGHFVLKHILSHKEKEAEIKDMHKHHHDHGTFLCFMQCYDRVRERWWSPFGNLPYGFDHGSLTVIPAGTCHEEDPGRVLIFNFQTQPYGNPHFRVSGT